MREVDYVRRGFRVEENARASVADLIRDIPYLIVAGLIPPLAVVNEVLRTGELDAGMSGGCVWSPFELSHAEFAEVVRDLETHGALGRPAHLEEVPSWVTTRREWGIWVAHHLHGVPVAENRELSMAMAETQAAMSAAAARGDEDQRVRHFIELSRLTSVWNALISRYRKPKQS